MKVTKEVLIEALLFVSGKLRREVRDDGNECPDCPVFFGEECQESEHESCRIIIANHCINAAKEANGYKKKLIG
jgi:hypothetical protein